MLALLSTFLQVNTYQETLQASVSTPHHYNTCDQTPLGSMTHAALPLPPLGEVLRASFISDSQLICCLSATKPFGVIFHNHCVHLFLI